MATNAGRARGSGHSTMTARRPLNYSEVIDVDELYDDEVVEAHRPPIEGVELIGSAARARVLGVNTALRNFKDMDSWMASQKREKSRRLEKRKRAAVDLTGVDGDRPAPAPVAGPSRVAAEAAGGGRRASRRLGMRARGASANGEGSSRPSAKPEVIVINDDEDLHHSAMDVSPPPTRSAEPEPEASDSEASWFEYDYEDYLEDPMDEDESEQVPSSHINKGKGKAVDENINLNVRRFTQREVPLFDLHNRSTLSRKKHRAKERILWDWMKAPRKYEKDSLNHLALYSRHQNSMYSMVSHRSALSRGFIPRTTDVLCTYLTVPRLMESDRYKKTSGVVNKIAQSNGIVAVASAVSGGERDDSDPDNPPIIDPYNRTGNLIFHTGEEFTPPMQRIRGQDIAVPTHFETWATLGTEGQALTNEEGMRVKYYTVNDIAFDPQNNATMVTTGNDCCLRVWDVRKAPGEKSLQLQDMLQLKYKDVVNDVQFRPASGTADPLLAISCFDGLIHCMEGLTARKRFALEVAPERQSSQKTGAFIWGTTYADSGVISSDGRLFASTEAPDELRINCHHVCFDVGRKQKVFSFDTSESGDMMALNAEGRTLALLTSTIDHRTLGLYDVTPSRSHRGSATVSVHLPQPSGEKEEWEVVTAKFSPDSTLLAIGLSDDRALVYDTRFISEDEKRGGPCVTYDFRCMRPADTKCYGITGLEWVPGYYGGHGLGLLTGGSDGYVRLWDVGQGHDPRDIDRIDNVIAKCDSGVASVSVSRNPKEHRLVVGDTDGEILIMD